MRSTSTAQAIPRPPRRLELVLLAGVSVSLLGAYAPVLAGLIRDWATDANYHHGFLIPVVSAYLLWSRRTAWRNAEATHHALGLLGLVFAAGLLILGTAGAEVFTQRIGFLASLGSLVLLLFGWRRFTLALFPIAFLLLAIPLPYVLYYGLTAPLQALAAKFAVSGLEVLGVPVFAQGNVLHLPETSLEVAEACSGIRSLYAFLAIGALVAYFTRIPWPGRVLIFALAIPLSVAGNAFRVWGSGLGAYLVGPEVTRGTVHELFGLLVFIVSLGILILIKRGARSLWSPAA